MQAVGITVCSALTKSLYQTLMTLSIFIFDRVNTQLNIQRNLLTDQTSNDISIKWMLYDFHMKQISHE